MFAQPLIDTKAPLRRPRHSAPVAAAEFFDREATVLTLALTGLDCHVVQVTARLEEGPAVFEIVGLPEARVRETRIRVRAGLQAVDSELPAARITVRFDHPEFITGGAADTAVAIAVLAVIGRIDSVQLKGLAIVGELSLTSGIRNVRGILPMLLGAAKLGLGRAIVPKASASEAALARGVRVDLADHLDELVRHFNDGLRLERVDASPWATPVPTPADLSEIRGQRAARRALEVAAAGGHGLLLIGPPGSGSMLFARRLPGILPDPTPEELLDITSMHSIAGLRSSDQGFVASRPFRAPHHTVSAAGLLGGGDPIRPGEVALAHHGVLLLDELHEFRGGTLESLALVLRDGHATIARAGIRVRFPAEPLLVAATHACPCGYAGDPSDRCTCTAERIVRYRARLQGPFTERLDVRLVLPTADLCELKREEPGESSARVRVRVTAARGIQLARARELSSAPTNSAVAMTDLERVATPDAGGTQLLTDAAHRLGFTPATIARVLRVARTIADLDGSDAVRALHIEEAMPLAAGATQPCAASTIPIRGPNAS
jgi:magnesium chelatase family protein